ncbi:MAG: hypothetical protein H7833_08470 [Magnetococcus sp. DMHC-1]|nr:hypothetical protein [Magnetococcales bacterium]
MLVRYQAAPRPVRPSGELRFIRQRRSHPCILLDPGLFVKLPRWLRGTKVDYLLLGTGMEATVDGFTAMGLSLAVQILHPELQVVACQHDHRLTALRQKFCGRGIGDFLRGIHGVAPANNVCTASCQAMSATGTGPADRRI